MNWFAEVLQGSGKSTLVQKLSERYSGCTLLREGDYSPVELAWFAYTDELQYQAVCTKYPELLPQIEANTITEQGKRVICYTTG